MSAKSAGRRDLLDRVIRTHRPAQWFAANCYSKLIESVRCNSSLLSPRSFRKRSTEDKNYCTERNVLAISKMAQFHQQMIRSPYTWAPVRPSIHSLSKHLFAQYDVPEFAHRAWFGNAKEIRVLLDIARGTNPRKAIARRELGPRLTKKASHYFANAPDRFGIKTTARWAQLRAMGANQRIADRIVQAYRGFDFDEPFSQSLLQFLARACQVKPDNRERSIVAPDDRELREMIQFIWRQKYVDASQVLGYRVLHDVPLQPNFSLQGRTLKSFRPGRDSSNKVSADLWRRAPHGRFLTNLPKGAAIIELQ